MTGLPAPVGGAGVHTAEREMRAAREHVLPAPVGGAGMCTALMRSTLSGAAVAAASGASCR